MDFFQYLSSWFHMDDEEEEEDESKNNEYENGIQETDVIKDKKKGNRSNQQNLSKVKKVKKSVRFTSGLTNKTKKRRPY